MTATTTPLPPNRNNGLLMLALVVSLLAMPFLIGAGLYFGGWKPTRTNQHGLLIDPPLPIPKNGLITTDGHPLPSSELADKWVLLLSLDSPCGTQCNQRIDEMRRIQVSMNKDMGRLRRVVISQTPNTPELLAAQNQQPDLLVFSAPQHWLPRSTSGSTYSIHIIDPLGRRVMEYPAETSAKEIRADLERLLKFAWTG